MMASAGGATRAKGRRATAIRFQQVGEGALMASLAERTASPSVSSRPVSRPTSLAETGLQWMRA